MLVMLMQVRSHLKPVADHRIKLNHQQGLSGRDGHPGLTTHSQSQSQIDGPIDVKRALHRSFQTKLLKQGLLLESLHSRL